MAVGYGSITVSDLTDKPFVWNMLTGTADCKVNTGSSNTTRDRGEWYISSGGNGELSREELTDSPVSGVNYKLAILNNTNNASGKPTNRDLNQSPVYIENGETYIASCYVRAVSDEVTLYFRVWDGASGKAKFAKSETILKSDGWLYREWTFTVDWEVNPAQIQIKYGLTGEGSIEYCAMKLQKGSMASPWAPAPEDLATTIVSTTYQAGASNTTPPTGSWDSNPVTVSQGQYLWTRVEYTDGKVSYSVARQGQDGEQGVPGVSACGLACRVNASNFTNTDPGQVYFHGFDENNNAANVDGWVQWNGKKIIISKGCHINPNKTMPYNTTLYSVLRLDSATAETGVWHDVAYIESSNSWEANTYTTAAPDARTAWAWNDATDIIIATYKEPGDDAEIVDFQLFTPPKKASELVEIARIEAKRAQDAADAAQEAADAAQDDIDNLEVGGRNLLLNSSFSANYNQWSNNYGHNITTEDGVLCGHISGTSGTNNISQNILSRISSDEVGQLYTVSADIKLVNFVSGGSNTMMQFHFGGSYDDNGTSKWLGATYVVSDPSFVKYNNQGWVRAIWVMKFDHKPISMSFNIYSRNCTGDLYYRNVKMERGNKVTDWTAAPEDTDATISDIQSDIDQLQPELIVGTHGSTATATWTGTSTRLTQLVEGTRIQYKLSSTGKADVTLNLTLKDGSTTGAIPVYYLNTTRLGTQYGVGAVIDLIYDGTNWRVLNPYIDHTYNLGRRQHTTAILALEAITKDVLICGNYTGYKEVWENVSFSLSYPILYASAAINANATATSTYESWNDVKYNTTGTIQSGGANKIIYLKGKLNLNTFTIAAAPFLTTVEPTSADGFHYIPLGVMSSATNGYFNTSNRVFAYINDGFQAVDMAAAGLADFALTSANGKTTNYYGGSAPTGGTYTVGDTWFDTGNGNAIYMWDGTEWSNKPFGTDAIADAAITNAKIGNIDAGKINAGYIDAARIKAGTIEIGKLDTSTQSAISDGTAAKEAIDNLEVGGRNLFKNTLDPVGTPASKRPRLVGQTQDTTGSSGTYTAATHGMRVTNTGATRTYIRFGSSTASSGSLNGLEPGQTYTLSFDAAWKLLGSDSGKANTTTAHMRVWFYSDKNKQGTFAYETHDFGTIEQSDKGEEMTGRCEYTFTVQPNVTILYFYISDTLSTSSYYTSGDYIELSNLKLEKGNKATDWSAAIEDTDAAIATAQSAADAAQSTADGAVTAAGNAQSAAAAAQATADNAATAASNAQTTANTANNRAVACRGVQSTSKSTRIKVVTASNFILEEGATVTVFNTTENTYTSNSVQLNVNGTGAIDVWVAGAVTSSTNQLLWTANSSITFTYHEDSNNVKTWRVQDKPGIWYGAACDIAASVAAKTTSVNEGVFFKGVTVYVPMTYENTNSSATLNVSGTGAKAIYYGTTTTRPTTGNGRGWLANRTVCLQFDGAYYRLVETSTIIDGGYIKTGVIDANLVSAGILTSKDGKTYFDLDQSKLVAGNGNVLINGNGIEFLGSDEARIYSVAAYNGDPNSMRLTYWNLNFGGDIMDIDLSQVGLTATEYDSSNPRTQNGEFWTGGVPELTTNYRASVHFQNLAYSSEGLEATIGFEGTNSRNVGLRGSINGDGVSSRFVTDTCSTATDTSEQIATDGFVWNAIKYSSVVGRTRTASGTANAADKSYKLYAQHFTLDKGTYSSSNAYSQLVMGDNHLDAAFGLASGTCNGQNVAVFFSMANDLSTNFVVGSKHGTLNGTNGWFATFSASIASGTALEINAIAIYFG